MKKMIVVSLLSVLAAAQVSSAAMIAGWKLNDGSGSTAVSSVNTPTDDGTLKGDAAFVPGGVSFDGSGDWIDSPVLGVTGAAARTISAWVKTDAAGATGSAIVSWGDSWATGKLGYRFSFKFDASGKLRAEIGGGYAVATTVVSDGQWHHVALTLADGETKCSAIKFYIDGQADAVTASGDGKAINTESAVITIGGSITPTYPTGNSQFWFKGSLADVRIYDEELSAAQVAAIVPEPATMALLGLGAMGMMIRRRR